MFRIFAIEFKTDIKMIISIILDKITEKNWHNATCPPLISMISNKITGKIWHDAP